MIRKIYILFLLFPFALCCSTSDRGEINSVISQTFKGDRLLHEGVNRIFVDKIYDGNINSSVKEIFESSLRTKINLNNKLTVVESRENSDLILKVFITEFTSEPVKFSSSGVTEETKLKMDSFIWILSSSTGEEHIRKKRVWSEQFYSDINSPVMSEFRAITVLTEQLADRIVSVITTGRYQEDSRK